jgi:hypothetical protein
VVNVLSAVRDKTDHPAFVAAFAVDPIFFFKEEADEGGQWSPPQLTSDEAVSKGGADALLAQQALQLLSPLVLWNLRRELPFRNC